MPKELFDIWPPFNIKYGNPKDFKPSTEQGAEVLVPESVQYIADGLVHVFTPEQITDLMEFRKLEAKYYALAREAPRHSYMNRALGWLVEGQMWQYIMDCRQDSHTHYSSLV